MAALSLVRSSSAEYESQTEIPRTVSAAAKALHLRSLGNVRMMNQGEQNLLDDLRLIDDSKSFAEFGSQSLYAYAVDWLKLTPAVAYNLISVMRRAKQVPELVEAIKDGRINVSAARKIAPVINSFNKDAWLELASSSSVAAIEKAVAVACPKQAVQESIRYVNGERLELKLGVSEEFIETFKELRDLLSQKSQSSIDSEDAIFHATFSLKRKPLAARTKHVVILRDGRRCTSTDASGARCEQTRWLDIHHIKEVFQGGDDSVENLRTVCGHHHRQIHN